MINPAEWLEQAKALPLGGKSQIAHGCGTGRKLLIENKETGWACWCYRCSLAGFVPKPKPSLSERISTLRKKEAAAEVFTRTLRPPMPATWLVDDWPEQARVWLYKAGMDKDWIQEIGFYWCSPMARVVMPIFNDEGKMIFWQARGFDPELPKYLSPPIPTGGKPLYRAHPVRPDPERDERTLCLTEDILSANKVGQCVTGWSILGTSLTALHEAEIVKFNPSRALVWLDPDAAGVSGRRKIVPQLRALGIDAKAVRADLDPKCYPLGIIRQRLLCIP